MRFLEGVEINGMFLSAKEIYSPILKSGEKKKDSCFFTSNKICLSVLLYPVPVAVLSHKVTGRGRCRSRDLLAKSWTLSEQRPLPSLWDCPCPQPPWNHRRLFPITVCCLVSITCCLWLLVEHRPMCEGDPLHPGHWFSFHPLARVQLSESVSLLLLVAIAQLLLCPGDERLSWEQAGILALPLGLSVVGVILLTLFWLLLFFIIIFHLGHSLCCNWFLFCRRRCVMYSWALWGLFVPLWGFKEHL